MSQYLEFLRYVEFKKYILRVKLSVYYIVSFTCNIYFLDSTYFIFNQFKSNKFSRFFCCCVYFEKILIVVDSYYKSSLLNHLNHLDHF